jgi:GTPase SAR1 family protein
MSDSRPEGIVVLGLPSSGKSCHLTRYARNTASLLRTNYRLPASSTITATHDIRHQVVRKITEVVLAIGG